MGFLSPWFLGGLLAAGLPVYIHLLKQHRSDPVQFSSVMFMERRTQSSVKHRRLKYLALLAMRLAIMLLLALLFANPFIRQTVGSLGGGRKFVAVAVDNSFSMRTGDRLARAKSAALDAVASMSPTDKGQVMTFASSVQMLTQATSDKAELQRAVQAIVAGDGRSSYGEISRTLRSMGQPDGLPVEAHVITDSQLSSMPTPFAELAIPPSTKLTVHSVSDKREPNWFVESVNAPRAVFQAKKVRIQTVVAGAGTPPGEIPVELVINGRTVETKKAMLAAENGRATVEFFLPEASYGVNRGEIRIPSKDSLAQDDHFAFAIDRKESTKILLIHDGRSGRSATYVAAAIESVPDAGYTVESLGADQAGSISPDRFSAVVLADVGSMPSSLESALDAYVKKGGGVLVALGGQSVARGKVPVTGDAIKESRYASREGERFLTAAEVDKTHPATARAGALEDVRFYQVASVDAGKGRVIAKLNDGSPLMYEKKMGEGRVLVLTSTLDNVANDLPLHPSFVPLMEQTAHFLSGFDPAPAMYQVDSFVELRSARDAGAAVDVLGPDGKRALSLKESASTQAFRLTGEGFYELRRANGRNEVIAVHADRRESDLDVVPKETLALWQGTGSVVGDGQGGKGPAGSADNTRPYSLWWYFALVLFGVSVVESIFASRYLTAERDSVQAIRRQAA